MKKSPLFPLYVDSETQKIYEKVKEKLPLISIKDIPVIMFTKNIVDSEYEQRKLINKIKKLFFNHFF
jgi:hypothetical protein